jgi:hypothetical protein
VEEFRPAAKAGKSAPGYALTAQSKDLASLEWRLLDMLALPKELETAAVDF